MTPWKIFAVWFAAVAVGTLLVALPDSDGPVVRISDMHGPGPLDLAGIGLIAVGSVVLWAWLIRRARRIAARLGGAGTAWLAAVFAAALAVVAWSVLTDSGWWWAAGAGAATAVQLIALGAGGDRGSV